MMTKKTASNELINIFWPSWLQAAYLKSNMQHFGFVVVNFHIGRKVNKPKTVAVSHQAPVKVERKKHLLNTLIIY